MLNFLTNCSLFVLLVVFSRQCTASPTQDIEHSLLGRGSEGPTPRPLFGTSTLNSTQLPLILATTDTESRASDTHSIDTIRNKLALWTYILDGQQFSTLDQIFASDAIANYTDPIGLLNGLDEIEDGLQKSQASFEASQTLLGSVFVEVQGARDAFSVAYYRSVQFRVGSGQPTYTLGMYQDSWFRSNPKEQAWRIIRRNLVDQVSDSSSRTKRRFRLGD